MRTKRSTPNYLPISTIGTIHTSIATFNLPTYLPSYPSISNVVVPTMNPFCIYFRVFITITLALNYVWTLNVNAYLSVCLYILPMCMCKQASESRCSCRPISGCADDSKLVNVAAGKGVERTLPLTLSHLSLSLYVTIFPLLLYLQEREREGWKEIISRARLCLGIWRHHKNGRKINCSKAVKHML